MKRKTLWLILICLMVFAMVLASCGPAAVEKEVVPKEEGPQYGGTLNAAIGDMAGNYWDPWYYVYAHHGMTPSLQKLGMGDWAAPREEWDFSATYAPPKATTGCLAESWEFTDPLTLTFHIRKGVRWHDKPPVNGRELTAYDVEYSFHRYCGLGSGFTEKSPYVSQPWAEWLTSVTATDEYTVVMKTAEPRPLLLEYLTSAGINNFIIAREVVDQTEDGYSDWRNQVGTGPFMLTDYVDGSSLTFVSNPDYWERDPLRPENTIPYVDGVKILIIPDWSTRLAALRSGKIFQVAAIGWEDAQSLIETNPELKNKAYTGTAVGLDLRVDEGPFQDIRVRQAVRMAIDMDEMARDYYSGATAERYYGTMAGPVHKDMVPSLDDYPKDVQEMFEYKPEKAKQLMVDAGYPDGFTTTLTVGLPSYPEDLGPLLANYLGNIGINVEIETMEMTTYWSYVFGKQHHHMCYHAAAGNWMPFETLVYLRTGTLWNGPNSSDPFYDGLLEQISTNFDENERAELAKQAEIYSTTQCWKIAMPVVKYWTFWQPWVKGYQGEVYLDCWNITSWFSYVWIDQELKESVGH